MFLPGTNGLRRRHVVSLRRDNTTLWGARKGVSIHGLSLRGTGRKLQTGERTNFDPKAAKQRTGSTCARRRGIAGALRVGAHTATPPCNTCPPGAMLALHASLSIRRTRPTAMNLTTFPYRTPSTRLSPTRAACFIAWFMVAFYVLASGRGLVPGLCATQAAMDAQCAVDGRVALLSNPAAGCCPKPVEPAPDACHPGDNKRPITPEESHCAFCNLVIGLADAPIALALLSLPPPAYAESIPLESWVAQEVTRSNAPSRAPPA